MALKVYTYTEQHVSINSASMFVVVADSKDEADSTLKSYLTRNSYLGMHFNLSFGPPRETELHKGVFHAYVAQNFCGQFLTIVEVKP